MLYAHGSDCTFPHHISASMLGPLAKACTNNHADPTAGKASPDSSEVERLKQRLALLKSEMVSTAASQEQEQQQAEEVRRCFGCGGC